VSIQSRRCDGIGNGNFGTKEKVMPPWQAAVRAHADFIATDQVEEVAKAIKGGR
jgi:hypothetical protein